LIILPPFQIVTLSKLGLERNFFNPIKDIAEKTADNVILIVEDQMLSP